MSVSSDKLMLAAAMGRAANLRLSCKHDIRSAISFKSEYIHDRLAFRKFSRGPVRRVGRNGQRQ